VLRLLADKEAITKSREILENIYGSYNRRIYVSPDPLQFLYNYEKAEDREVVALIASSLAYGKVAQILKSVAKVLDILGPAPAAYLAAAERDETEEKLKDFVHRFTDGKELSGFLSCIGGILRRSGTLEELFLSHYKNNAWDAAEAFVSELLECGGKDDMFLLPRPSKGSACKRLALFLRWMVRCDDVDPGGWAMIKPDALFIPLDTHMFNICTTLGLCTRRAADGRAAVQITDSFRMICPEDPVRYDFSLTRFGIRSDMSLENLFDNWKD
jgi:uncharacterized protein (TIGR02757 family)